MMQKHREPLYSKEPWGKHPGTQSRQTNMWMENLHSQCKIHNSNGGFFIAMLVFFGGYIYIYYIHKKISLSLSIYIFGYPTKSRLRKTYTFFWRLPPRLPLPTTFLWVAKPGRSKQTHRAFGNPKVILLDKYSHKPLGMVKHTQKVWKIYYKRSTSWIISFNDW